MLRLRSVALLAGLALVLRLRNRLQRALMQALFRARAAALSAGWAKQDHSALFLQLDKSRAPPSPEAITLAEMFKAIPPVPSSLPLAKLILRAAYSGRTFGPVLDVPMQVSRFEVGGVRCVWVESPGHARDKRVVLYSHGGGYVTGTFAGYRNVCADLSRRCACRVLFVDYDLVPKKSVEEIVSDHFKVYRWLLGTLGVPAKSIVVSGDSAGGGLALGLLQRIVGEAVESPAAGVLISPWADLSNQAPTHKSENNREAIFREPEFFNAAGKHIAERAGRPVDCPSVSSLFGDFVGLPKLFVCAAESEALRGDSDQVVARARDAGVAVEYEVQPYGLHDFPLLAFWGVPEAEESLGRLCEFVCDSLEADP